jgi:hypothetical protein
MHAYGISNGFVRFRTLFTAVVFGAVLLGGPDTSSQANHAVDSETTPASREMANAHPGASWSQLPIESRELWKFRLTRGR